MVRIYEERIWGEERTPILVPTEHEYPSAEAFRKAIRGNPELVKPGTYRCIPVGRFSKPIKIERFTQTRIL